MLTQNSTNVSTSSSSSSSFVCCRRDRRSLTQVWSGKIEAKSTLKTSNIVQCSRSVFAIITYIDTQRSVVVAPTTQQKWLEECKNTLFSFRRTLFFRIFLLHIFHSKFVITVKSLLHSASGRAERRRFILVVFSSIKTKAFACAGALEMSSNCLWKHFHRVFFFGSLIRPLTLGLWTVRSWAHRVVVFFLLLRSLSSIWNGKHFFIFFFSFLKNLHFSCTSIPPGRKRVSRRCEWRAARKFLCATLKHTEEGRDVVCSIQKSSMECFVHFPSHQALTLWRSTSAAVGKQTWRSFLTLLLAAQSSSHSNDAELGTSVMKKRLIYFRLIKSEGEANDAFLMEKRSNLMLSWASEESSSSSRAIDEETTHENANINHKNIFFRCLLLAALVRSAAVNLYTW